MPPLNPEFVQYQTLLQSGRLPATDGSGHTLGYMPPPYLLPVSAPRTLLSPLELIGPRTLPPAAYSLRTVAGKLSPVRDQVVTGTCWDFATFGSLESCLRPGTVLDLSENHLKNTHGFNYGPTGGGNSHMSTAYFARWGGPVLETSDPYNAYSGVSPAGLAPVRHVQQVWWVPVRSGPTDNDTIKNLVMTKGGVWTCYYHDDANYKASTYGYYDASAATTNHAVVIVGWDDNFATSNFNTPPPGKGAFLIRNSWGSGWGDGGYFYISYYDAKLGRVENALFPSAEASTNYAACRSYDFFGAVSQFTAPWTANVFSTSGATSVGAVGLYGEYSGATYEVKVYRNPPAGNPSGGVLAGQVSGSLTYPGYYTIPLPTPAVIQSSDTSFAVCAHLTGGTYASAIECPIAGYCTAATAAAGQSYFSGDGTTWTDLTTFKANTNACLKAFLGAPPPTVTMCTPKGTGIATTANIVMRFSTPMKRATVESHLYLNGTLVSGGVFTWAGTRVTYDPPAAFAPNKRYQVKLSRVAKSKAGVPMAADKIWAFTTGAAAPALVTATAAPTHAGAQITVNLTADAEVTVHVRNLAGRDVALLQPGRLPAGMHSLAWDGRSRTGTRLPRGTYLVDVAAQAADGSLLSIVTPLRW